MKTRSFAAKALSAVVLATTVSGYALAGDHQISVSSSWDWCRMTYESETTDSGTNYAGTNVGGGCTSTDSQVNFSGKIGGWSYYYEVDPGSGNIVSDMRSSVSLNKDLGNGLSVGLGDTGDGDAGKNFAGHKEWATHDGGGAGAGGVKLSYSKGALNARLVYGGDSPLTDNQSSAISVGADFTVAGWNIGGSYHTYSAGEIMKAHGSTKDRNGMVFGVQGTVAGFNIAADYETKTVKTDGADDQGYSMMGFHAWGGKGTYRPHVSYTISNQDDKVEASATASTYTDKWSSRTNMAVGVTVHPAGWGGASLYAKYTTEGYKFSTENAILSTDAQVTGVQEAKSNSKMGFGVSLSADIL